MEEKYCERCGLYLGVVRPTRRYCSECKRKVDKERHREREKSGGYIQAEKCVLCILRKADAEKSSIPEVPQWMRKKSLQRKGEPEC